MGLYIAILLLILALTVWIVPTSTNDKRALQYKVKYIEKCPSFDCMVTNLAKNYKDKLKNCKTSGAAVIENGLDAFILRSAFARLAEKSIDLQTYIFKDDNSSRLLINELRMAADRGVKVRILVDDNGVDSDTSDIMMLDLHPNIQVKIFNTFKYRKKFIRYFQFLFDFKRLNCRMHNKLFIVDGIAVILGGRNIADNYFYLEKSVNFSDTDVLFLGKIAVEALASFEDYWNYHLAIPAELFPVFFRERQNERSKRNFDYEMKKRADDAKIYDDLVEKTINDYKNNKFKFYWGNGRIIADMPSKIEKTTEQKINDPSPILKELRYLWKKTVSDIYISAAYFVPGKIGQSSLIDEEKKGVEITVVTNSLASTNQASVYAAWERYRRKLIKNKVKVYEFMNNGNEVKKDKFKFFTSLHSKTIVFDDKLSWIGSFNLDHRSALYNTEIVAVFENKEFAAILKNLIKNDIKNSWRVTIEKLITTWTGKPYYSKKIIKVRHSPDTTLLKRFLFKFMRLVPESLI